MRETFRALREMVRLLDRKAWRKDAARLNKIKEIIAEACRNIENVIEE